MTFFDDPDDAKSDLVDGVLGELSAFHETHGYHTQGVSITTATLPRGWRDRLIVVETASTAPGPGHCLDDCVTSKLLAGREKDFAFAAALIREDLIDPAILSDRVAFLDDVHPVATERGQWLVEPVPENPDRPRPAVLTGPQPGSATRSWQPRAAGGRLD